MTTGPGETLAQSGGEARLVVDCKKNVPLVGQVSTTFKPDGVMVNCGGTTGSERLNTVPDPEEPPSSVVPLATPWSNVSFGLSAISNSMVAPPRRVQNEHCR